MLSKKLNIIAGLDMNGKIYVAVTQINCNTDVMVMFITHLAKLLKKEREDPDLRICLNMDGASYMRNSTLKQTISSFGMDYSYGGPQSYDCHSMEYLYSLWKRGLYCPPDQPTGKSSVSPFPITFSLDTLEARSNCSSRKPWNLKSIHWWSCGTCHACIYTITYFSENCDTGSPCLLYVPE